MKTILIDNYDSFTFNLYHYLSSLKAKVDVIRNDKITSKQHGFLPEKSCTTQMLNFTTDLAINLNSLKQTDIIYFDFAKAFDSVSHDIILQN